MSSNALLNTMFQAEFGTNLKIEDVVGFLSTRLDLDGMIEIVEPSKAELEAYFKDSDIHLTVDDDKLVDELVSRPRDGWQSLLIDRLVDSLGSDDIAELSRDIADAAGLGPGGVYTGAELLDGMSQFSREEYLERYEDEDLIAEMQKRGLALKSVPDLNPARITMDEVKGLLASVLGVEENRVVFEAGGGDYLDGFYVIPAAKP